MGTTPLKDKVEHALAHWNTHDDRYFELYDAGAPIHGMPPGVPATVEGMKGFFHQMWTSFPDMRVDLLRVTEQDDLFAAQFRVSGTHEGEFLGALPTGNRIEFEAMTFMRFGSEGTVVERWTRMDETSLLMQLGLLPAPAGAPA